MAPCDRPLVSLLALSWLVEARAGLLQGRGLLLPLDLPLLLAGCLGMAPWPWAELVLPDAAGDAFGGLFWL